MNQKQLPDGPKTLVTVFDDLETAKLVAEKLYSEGFLVERIELVSHDIHDEAPTVEAPIVHETTEGALFDGAAKWGGTGAGVGLLAGLLTTFPGLALGMAIVGGVTGAIMGGIAGVDHAVNDDSYDLPTLEEYEQLVNGGKKLVVVLGTHEEVIKAEQIVRNMRHVRSHIHPVHGHLYHEHSAPQNPQQPS